MREEIVAALRQHFEAGVARHSTNVRIMLEKPQAIPEHSDWIETVELELQKLAECQDKLEALEIVLNK